MLPSLLLGETSAYAAVLRLDRSDGMLAGTDQEIVARSPPAGDLSRRSSEASAAPPHKTGKTVVFLFLGSVGALGTAGCRARHTEIDLPLAVEHKAKRDLKQIEDPSRRRGSLSTLPEQTTG